LGNFLGSDEGIAAIKKFMAESQDAKTIIFDVRTHVGGGLEEMDIMFPYLFDKETTLVTMDTRSAVERAGGFPLAGAPRLRIIPSPDTVVRREHYVVPEHGAPMAKAKVFVLASGRTASAGEHFVLSLRRTHRATVIGETTYGAGNFGSLTQLEGDFSVFIPVGRTFDPDTNKGWDYAGIAPDVAVPAAAALTEALVRSGVSKPEAETLSAKYGPTADAVSSKRKAPASVAGI
jgi:C-terminal processing protease CtpA/Prc